MPTQQKSLQAVATLARLDLTAGLDPSEAQATIERFETQFSGIIKLVGSLASVDTSNVEPLHWPLPAQAPQPREDLAAQHCTRDELLSNAPEQDGEFFVVPRIV